MANIVKHSFIKGPKVASRARAHLNYIQHRPGEDKEKDKTAVQERDPARPLYVVGIEDDPAKPGKAGQDFKDALWNKDERGRVVHKFILSPSVKDVDMYAYTREVMDSIGTKKGQDLKYAFVVHDNTDNRHAHVVVLGKDAEGHDVRFGRPDYVFMKHFGDRYLEREHGVELRFDKDMEMMARVQGHNLYLSNLDRTLQVLEQPPKERSWQIDEDFRHLLNINKNWNESLEGPSREGGLSLGSTWLHDRGRLVEVHDIFQNTADKDRWQDVYNNTGDQNLKEYAEKRLVELDEQRQNTVNELQDKLGLRPENFDAFIKDIQEQFAEENREIDMVLHPEKYEPRDHHIDRRNIDYDRIDGKDKIVLDSGKILTKYDTANYLDKARLDLIAGAEERIPREEYGKLCSWIGTKEVHGDNCYGQPPFKAIEVEKSLDIDKLASERAASLEGLSDDTARSARELNDILKPVEPELAEFRPDHVISIQDALDARDPSAKSLDQMLMMVREHDGPEFDPAEIERSIREPAVEREIDEPALKEIHEPELQEKPELEPDQKPYQIDYEIDVDDDYVDDLDFEPEDFTHDMGEDSDENKDIEPILDIEQNGGLEYELDHEEKERSDERGDNRESGEDDDRRDRREEHDR